MTSSPEAVWERARNSTPLSASARLSLGDVISFVIPLAQVFQFKTIGTLYGTDLGLLLALPFLLATNTKWVRQKPIPMFIVLSFLWLTAQVISDLLNNTPPEDYTRGWSKILLTASHFVAIALLLKDSKRRVILYGVGYVLGGILSVVLNPTSYSEAEPWKFGFGGYVTIFTCLIAGLIGHKYRILSAAMILTIGAANVFLGARSMGALCVAACIYTYVVQRTDLSIKRRNPPFVKLAFFLALGVWAIQSGYSYAASSGILGDAAQDKYEEQASGEGGLLLGGRSELFASSAAIIDAPLFGHGSWAKDPQYAATLSVRRGQLGYRTTGASENDLDLIPSHSHLLGAWVESGVMGALFWGWVFVLVVSAMRRADGTEPLIPFIAFVGVTVLWDVLFSPYGAVGRFASTYYIYAVISLERWRRGSSRT